MLIPYDDIWLPYLKVIDIKSYEWPWCDEDWKDISKYIVKIAINSQKPTGFSACKIIPNAVLILKLAVYPSDRQKRIGSQLLQDIENLAARQLLKMVCVTVHEEDEHSILWLISKGYQGAKIVQKLYPDDRDGYTFYKDIKI